MQNKIKRAYPLRFARIPPDVIELLELYRRDRVGPNRQPMTLGGACIALLRSHPEYLAGNAYLHAPHASRVGDPLYEDDPF